MYVTMPCSRTVALRNLLHVCEFTTSVSYYRLNAFLIIVLQGELLLVTGRYEMHV